MRQYQIYFLTNIMLTTKSTGSRINGVFCYYHNDFHDDHVHDEGGNDDAYYRDGDVNCEFNSCNVIIIIMELLSSNTDKCVNNINYGDDNDLVYGNNLLEPSPHHRPNYFNTI